MQYFWGSVQPHLLLLITTTNATATENNFHPLPYSVLTAPLARAFPPAAPQDTPAAGAPRERLALTEAGSTPFCAWGSRAPSSGRWRRLFFYWVSRGRLAQLPRSRQPTAAGASELGLLGSWTARGCHTWASTTWAWAPPGHSQTWDAEGETLGAEEAILKHKVYVKSLHGEGGSALKRGLLSFWVVLVVKPPGPAGPPISSSGHNAHQQH